MRRRGRSPARVRTGLCRHSCRGRGCLLAGFGCARRRGRRLRVVVQTGTVQNALHGGLVSADGGGHKYSCGGYHLTYAPGGLSLRPVGSSRRGALGRHARRTVHLLTALGVEGFDDQRVGAADETGRARGLTGVGGMTDIDRVPVEAHAGAGVRGQVHDWPTCGHAYVITAIRDVLGRGGRRGGSHDRGAQRGQYGQNGGCAAQSCTRGTERCHGTPDSVSGLDRTVRLRPRSADGAQHRWCACRDGAGEGSASMSSVALPTTEYFLRSLRETECERVATTCI